MGLELRHSFQSSWMDLALQHSLATYFAGHMFTAFVSSDVKTCLHNADNSDFRRNIGGKYLPLTTIKQLISLGSLFLDELVVSQIAQKIFAFL
jgi:hypothetical protein